MDVKVKELKYPMGAWPKDKHMKECGKTMQDAAETAFEAFGLALLTKYTNMSPGDVKEMCKKAFEDVKSRRVHGYLKMWFIVGRKPE